MAYFIASKKKEGWQSLKPFFLNLATAKGKKKLEEYEKYEFLQKLTYLDATTKAFALVEGELMWTYKASPIKTQTLEKIVKDKIVLDTARELLEPVGFKERKTFLQETG